MRQGPLFSPLVIRWADSLNEASLLNGPLLRPDDAFSGLPSKHVEYGEEISYMKVIYLPAGYVVG